MRVNIESCSNNGSLGTKEWVLEELVKNLKELRNRTDGGDMKALDEFFDLFVFNDDQFREKVGAGGTVTDSDRLEWLMRNVSGKEFRRLGVHYGGNCGRDRIDAAMTPHNAEVTGAPISDATRRDEL